VAFAKDDLGSSSSLLIGAIHGLRGAQFNTKQNCPAVFFETQKTAELLEVNGLVLVSFRWPQRVLRNELRDLPSHASADLVRIPEVNP
jgi:hypothetical protein